MQKITVTIEAKFEENEDKFEIRITGDPSPETLGTYAKNIRAILMLAAANAINSTFQKVGGETKTKMSVEVTK